MRIVCIGQAAFGEKILQKLTEKGEEVVAVYTPQDTAGKKNPLKELAINEVHAFKGGISLWKS